MRMVLRFKVLSGLEVMQKAHVILEKGLTNTNNCYDILVQLQSMAIALGNEIEQEEKDSGLILQLEEYCELIYQVSQSLQKQQLARAYSQRAVKCLEKINSYVKEQMPEKIKIAFFPYKYSMWDSLESIWEAANQDERCICQVIPIPYYQKITENDCEEMVYEGEIFQKKIPIIDYQSYEIGKEKPDIIYVHNPFDQYNKVTCIDSRFFSSELKKENVFLIYVPYFMAGYCRHYENMKDSCLTSGAINSDLIILQSEKLKEAYSYCGIDEKKLLVTGSPKVDYILSLEQTEHEVPATWEKVFKARKVFLINTSIHTFLNNKNWLCKIKEIADEIIREEDAALIWRPHPLLKQTIAAMKPEFLPEYESLEDHINSVPNGIIDYSEDSALAIYCSDAMISDYSSLVLQYTFTGKPTLVLTGNESNRKHKVFCDYFSNYFLNDGIGIGNFIQIVKNGQDIKRELRMQQASESITNADGTCGKQTHEAVLEKIYFWE